MPLPSPLPSGTHGPDNSFTSEARTTPPAGRVVTVTSTARLEKAPERPEQQAILRCGYRHANNSLHEAEEAVAATARDRRLLEEMAYAVVLDAASDHVERIVREKSDLGMHVDLLLPDKATIASSIRRTFRRWIDQAL